MERIISVGREDALIVLKDLKTLCFGVGVCLLHIDELLYLHLIGLVTEGSNTCDEFLLSDFISEIHSS